MHLPTTISEWRNSINPVQISQVSVASASSKVVNLQRILHSSVNFELTNALTWPLDQHLEGSIEGRIFNSAFDIAPDLGLTAFESTANLIQNVRANVQLGLFLGNPLNFLTPWQWKTTFSLDEQSVAHDQDPSPNEITPRRRKTQHDLNSNVIWRVKAEQDFFLAFCVFLETFFQQMFQLSSFWLHYCCMHLWLHLGCPFSSFEDFG